MLKRIKVCQKRIKLWGLYDFVHDEELFIIFDGLFVYNIKN